MVSLSQIREANATITTVCPSLTAVFAGGTSGIGEASLKALAANSERPTVYIVGRNEERASRIIKECNHICPDGTFAFLKADLSLLRNVDAVCDDILERGRDRKLDLLFMSQGYITFEGRQETSEGLDTLMSLRYYSRMRLLNKLLPLLTQATNPRIVSIFAPGKEGRLFEDDLSLRKHYSLFNNISHVAFMTTFFFEAIVRQHPALSCLHVFPGLVKTAEFENGQFPQWLKWFFAWIFLPLVTPLCISVEECGERNLFHATNGMYPGTQNPDTGTSRSTPVPDGCHVARGINGMDGSGVYNVDWNGEIIKRCESVFREWREKGMDKTIWNHTMEVFNAVDRGQVFEG